MNYESEEIITVCVDPFDGAVSAKHDHSRYRDILYFHPVVRRSVAFFRIFKMKVSQNRVSSLMGHLFLLSFLHYVPHLNHLSSVHLVTGRFSYFLIKFIRINI